MDIGEEGRQVRELNQMVMELLVSGAPAAQPAPNEARCSVADAHLPPERAQVDVVSDPVAAAQLEPFVSPASEVHQGY